MVLDANILIRAVLGVRVFLLISRYAKQVALVAPDTAFEEAREKLPAILQKRKVAVAEGLATLDSLRASIESLPPTVYSPFEAVARRRNQSRRYPAACPQCEARGRIQLPRLGRAAATRSPREARVDECRHEPSAGQRRPDVGSR